jgi:hypothetical protein
MKFCSTERVKKKTRNRCAEQYFFHKWEVDTVERSELCIPSKKSSEIFSLISIEIKEVSSGFNRLEYLVQDKINFELEKMQRHVLLKLTFRGDAWCEPEK